MPVGLTNVVGTTVDEFMQNAGAIFGAGTLGETKPALNVKWKADHDGNIKSATMTLAITSTSAHWSGSGMSNGKRLPQPDAANRTAIDRVEVLNKLMSKSISTPIRSPTTRRKPRSRKNSSALRPRAPTR